MSQEVHVDLWCDVARAQGREREKADTSRVLSWGKVSVRLDYLGEREPELAAMTLAELLALGERTDGHHDIKLVKPPRKRGPNNPEKVRDARLLRAYAKDHGFDYITDGGNYSYTLPLREAYAKETGIWLDASCQRVQAWLP